MEGEDTVYNDPEKLDGSSWGFYISWVNNPVTTYGNSRPVGVVLLGAYLAHCSLFSSVRRYIFILNDFECFSYHYLLFIEDFFTCYNPL